MYPDVVLSFHPRPRQLADFAIKAHMPTMRAFRFYVDAGGLMSHDATQSEIYTMAAEQVARILDGARPSDLPLRQATRFELVINLKDCEGPWPHHSTIAPAAGGSRHRVVPAPVSRTGTRARSSSESSQRP